MRSMKARSWSCATLSLETVSANLDPLFFEAPLQPRRGPRFKPQPHQSTPLPDPAPSRPQFGQIRCLAVDSARVAQHNKPRPERDLCPIQVGPLRIFLIVGGVLFGVIALAAVWVLLPKSTGEASAQPAALVAQATPDAPTPAPNAAETSTDASPEGEEGSLRVCNQTPNPVSIALGYRADRGWQSEGWWVAQPTECKTVFSGKLDARYYYIYAADDIGGGSWDGANYMCTRDETFTIFGVEDCLARGYERTGFFEIDTQNRSNWMLQLTDGEVLGAEPAPGTDDIPLEGEALPSGE